MDWVELRIKVRRPQKATAEDVRQYVIAAVDYYGRERLSDGDPMNLGHDGTRGGPRRIKAEIIR